MCYYNYIVTTIFCLFIYFVLIIIIIIYSVLLFLSMGWGDRADV